MAYRTKNVSLRPYNRFPVISLPDQAMTLLKGLFLSEIALYKLEISTCFGHRLSNYRVMF